VLDPPVVAMMFKLLQIRGRNTDACGAEMLRRFLEVAGALGSVSRRRCSGSRAIGTPVIAIPVMMPVRFGSALFVATAPRLVRPRAARRPAVALQLVLSLGADGGREAQGCNQWEKEGCFHIRTTTADAGDSCGFVSDACAGAARKLRAAIAQPDALSIRRAAAELSAR
jgi:hypothetical protein